MKIYTHNAVVLIMLVSMFAGCGGCRDSNDASESERRREDVVSSHNREELMTYAIDNLDQLDEFTTANVVPQIHRRLREFSEAESENKDQPFDSLLAAWPETEILGQIVDRLNQWIRPLQPPAYSLDPMITSLPQPLAYLPQVKNLGEMNFTSFDGYALQEAVWLKNISSWARGDMLDDLHRATNLFDWTMRNIQIEPDSPKRIPLFPWETLLFGRGTATERAWVFVLLLRQLEIDAAVLTVEREQATGDAVEPWCVGVLIDGEIYLFDPLIGLPIPGPDGVARDESGGLSIRPATLAEVRADKKLLERMNVAEEKVYRVKLSDLDHLNVLLEASPQYLAVSMKMLESRLAGKRKMVLTTSPSTSAENWKKTKSGDVRLWLHPYETLRRRSNLTRPAVSRRLLITLPFYIIPDAPLWRGRLRYMKGEFVGEHGAMSYYQKARPSNAELRASSIDEQTKWFLLAGKHDASYWCGLIAFQRGDFDAAVNYFKKRTLEAFSKSPWTIGARYNLARTYEASGQTERATLTYGLNSSSPGYYGDLLRAKWLRELGR